MKKGLIIAIASLLCAGAAIVGFVVVNGNKKNVDVNSSGQQSVQETTGELRKEIKIANNWMSLPEKVDMVWKTEEKNTSNYQTSFEFKRDNNIMGYGESYENGKYITMDNDGISNEYYYYHYKGDYKWSSYCYFSTKGWDSWYFKGNFPDSPQNYCFGRPWNILDEYSGEHETVSVEGIGDVDTVSGVDDEGYTYHYSKELNMNIKIENKVQTWTLKKFDTNVSANFPYSLPDMDIIDAKETTKTENTSSSENDSQKVYEDENGELVVYDE